MVEAINFFEMKLIFKSPITGENIEIAEKDLEHPMILQDAIEQCTNFRCNWRLPTVSELEIMYQEMFLKGIGNFKSEIYITITRHPSSRYYIESFNFRLGPEHKDGYINEGDDKLYVRLVREIT